MIEIFTIPTEHRFGDPRYQLHRFRHKFFIQGEKYRVPAHHGMEFDRYDNPATTYFVYRDQAHVIRGTIRIHPTTLPYMIAEKPPFLIKGDPPSEPGIWESTRVGIDARGPLRKRIIAEIVLAKVVCARSQGIEAYKGIEAYIGVIPRRI